jgi:pyruvate-formate lyase-activating enzyme
MQRCSEDTTELASPAPGEPPVNHLRLIREQQRLASVTLTFCVTRRCPLTCAHCYQESGPKVSSPILGLELARKFTSELPALVAAGLEYVGFTGGEPTLALDFVRHVSDACAEHGVETGIVSAAHWAGSDASAERMLARLPAIACWDLSTDRYHLEQVPLANIERAFRLLSAQGKPPLVRFAHHAVPEAAAGAFDPDDAALVRAIHAFAGERISFQAVQARGRGRALPLRRKPATNAAAPLFCMSEGLLIDEEGRVLPCGSLLAAERTAHALVLGNAYESSFTSALLRWRAHPLLQLLRLGTLPATLGRLPALAGERALEGESDCERCVGLLRDPSRVARLLRALEQPEAVSALARAHDSALAVRSDARSCAATRA